jgi:hypothetical protein
MFTDNQMKPCIECKLIKEMDRFYFHNGMADKRLNKCITCCRAYGKKHAADNKEKRMAYKRRDWNNNSHRRRQQKSSRYKKMCGVGIEWVDVQRVKQDGHCAICLQIKPLVLDHNHQTKKPRGLLCRQCNSAIGLLQDSVDVVTMAASYLAMGGF